MAITITSDSATISTTEYYLASDSTSVTYQTADCILQVYIDFANMIAGDQYTVKVYEKINAGTARVVYQTTLSGVQATPHVTPSLIVGEGWECSVTRNAGTDRSIAWSLRTVS